MAVKLQADSGQFRKEMQEAANSVKQLSTESKLADSELRKTGNTQSYVQQKTAALTKQIEAQRKAVQAAEKAVDAMAATYGQNSKEVAQWQAELNKAKTSLNNLEAELDGVQKGTDRMQAGVRKAAKETKALDSIRLQGLNTALTNISGTISKVTSAAAGAAKAVWNMAKDAAGWADTLATDASRYGIDTKTLQQWQYAARFVDVEASTVAAAQNKLLSSMKSGGAAFAQLGVQTRTAAGTLRDTNSVFWDSIEALSVMTDETERDAAAQDLFGKSFAELRPLIDAGRKSWEAYCEEAERAGLILGDEQVAKLNRFHDSIDRMDATFESLKLGVMADLAPAFESIADTATEAAHGILEWTHSAEGQETIKGLADAIQDVVKSFADGGLEGLLTAATDALRTFGDMAAWAAKNAGWLVPTLMVTKGVTGIGGAVLKGATTLKLLKAGSAIAGGAKAAGGAAAAVTGAKAAGTLAAATGAKAAGAVAATGAKAAGTVAATAGGAGAGGGILSGLAPLASGAAGFGLGMMGVIGAGKLAQVVALPKMSSADAYADGNFANYEKSGVKRDLSNLEKALQQIREEYAVDYREDKKSKVTAGDITQAINDAKVNASSTTNNTYNITQGDVQTDIEIAAANWQEALEVATHDGKITKHEFDAIQSYLAAFETEITNAQATVTTDWQALVDQANTPPPPTPKPVTERQVLEFGAMTRWVVDTTGRDMQTATNLAAAAWGTLMGKVGSPEKLGVTLSQQTGEEAAQAGDPTFKALSEWVKATLGADETTAETEAKKLWNAMRAYALDPGDLDKEYTYTGQGGTSDVFQEYVKKTWGPDAEAAQKLLQGYYNDLESGAQNPNGGSNGNTTGDTGHQDTETPAESNSYFSHVVTQLESIYADYTALMAQWAEMLEQNPEITLSPEMQAELDEIRGKLNRALGEVEWYETDAYMQGKGAMGLAAAGIDYDKNYDAALEWIIQNREHGKAGFEAEVEALEQAAGVAYQEYQEAVGRGEDTDAALQAYEDAQAAYTAALEALPGKLEELEAEYQRNIIALAAGSASTTGYKGTGKGSYVAVTAGERTGTAPVPQGMTNGDGHYYSPYVTQLTPVQGHWVNGTWAANEEQKYNPTIADTRLTEGMMNMTEEAKEVASQLAASFSSWDEFVNSLSEQDKKGLEGAMGGWERDFWEEIGFFAFGRRPTSSNYQPSYMKRTDEDARETEFFGNVMALLGSRSISPQDSADRINADLQKLVDEYDEASGYNAARERVQQFVDSGLFTGFDWSLVSGGMVEDIIADMAREFEERGEEIPESLGKGMESSADTIFTEADLEGKAKEDGEQAGNGLAEGLDASAPRVQASAQKLAGIVDNTFRKTLRIQSPSKVMEGLGQYVGEGFALGIEDMVTRVRASVAAMTLATTQPVAAYAGRAAGDAAGSTYNATSSVYVDKYYQNSAEDIGYLSDQLADRQQRQLQGFGHRG